MLLEMSIGSSDYFGLLFDRNLRDVLETIFVRMMNSAEDLRSCAKVCKRWRRFLTEGQMRPSARKVFKRLSVPWIWTRTEPAKLEIPLPDELMNEGDIDVLKSALLLTREHLFVVRGFKCMKIGRKKGFNNRCVKTLQCDSLSKPQHIEIG